MPWTASTHRARDKFKGRSDEDKDGVCCEVFGLSSLSLRLRGTTRDHEGRARTASSRCEKAYQGTPRISSSKAYMLKMMTRRPREDNDQATGGTVAAESTSPSLRSRRLRVGQSRTRTQEKRALSREASWALKRPGTPKAGSTTITQLEFRTRLVHHYFLTLCQILQLRQYLCSE